MDTKKETVGTGAAKPGEEAKQDPTKKPAEGDKAGTGAAGEAGEESKEGEPSREGLMERIKTGVDQAYGMSQNRSVNRVLEGVKKDLEKLATL